MDQRLRDLERLASGGDPTAKRRYLIELTRSGVVPDIERHARLRDPEAVNLYLQILDIQHIIELNSLWVCPFISHGHDFEDEYPIWPYTTAFTPPIPFRIGMTLLDVEAYYAKLFEYQPNSLVGAFIVDVFDLEAAEAVGWELYEDLQTDLTSRGRDGAVSTRRAAQLIANYTKDLAKFSLLRRSAILVLDGPPDVNNKAHFIEADEIRRSRRERSTVEYYREASGRRDRRRRSDEVQTAYIAAPSREETETWWPHRLVKQLPVYIPPVRSSEDLYVAVVHRPSLRGFGLSGGYRAFKSELTLDEITNAMRYNLQVGDGWFPTSGVPDWAAGLPESEFTAFWVAT